jgi:hypothetical protein
MSLTARLRRLEEGEWDQRLYREAERMAKQHGRDPDLVLRELQEIAERVQRWGVDAEVRRFADESGLSEDKARALFDSARREIEDEAGA